MENILNNDILVLITLASFFTLVFVAFALVFKITKKTWYNEERQRVELEKLRAHFENKIYRLTENLLKNENRWQDVNHLLISSQNKIDNLRSDINEVQPNDFLKVFNLDSNDYKIDKKLIFVLTPFHTNFDDTFDKIAEVARKIGFKCNRGDEENIAGETFPYILKQIVKARVIIANIDGRNPNVYYELGIAQAINKPTIMITNSVETLPFDFRGKQLVVYNNEETLGEHLKTHLLKILS